MNATVQSRTEDLESEGTDSIVALDRFIQSTRDSGYRNTSSAISELVDNAFQAEATTVAIFVESNSNDCDYPLSIRVEDDGNGMLKHELIEAVRFGGSSRYNQRNGLGRFGMGLPNASLSQSRRFTVRSSATEAEEAYETYLDVDEIVGGNTSRVPLPIPTKLHTSIGKGNGTVVTWDACDRLDNKRASTIARKLHQNLGRIYRYFLWEGREILINDEPVIPSDPTFLRSERRYASKLFGEEWECEFADVDGRSGLIKVKFAELPLEKLYMLPNKDKRAVGIANGAGVSIVREGREIDFGWFFMGQKRKENYDDWWRCEIVFEATLDEAFGITHTKQQVRPTSPLIEAIQPEIELTAKALNARVRERFSGLKQTKAAASAVDLLNAMEGDLKPIPKKALNNVQAPASFGHKSTNHRPERRIDHRLIFDDSVSAQFCKPLADGSTLSAVLNKSHPFYREIYHPLEALAQSTGRDELLKGLQVLLLSLSRTAVANSNTAASTKQTEKFLREWSDLMRSLLNEKSKRG